MRIHSDAFDAIHDEVMKEHFLRIPVKQRKQQRKPSPSLWDVPNGDKWLINDATKPYSKAWNIIKTERTRIRRESETNGFAFVDDTLIISLLLFVYERQSQKYSFLEDEEIGALKKATASNISLADLDKPTEDLRPNEVKIKAHLLFYKFISKHCSNYFELHPRLLEIEFSISNGPEPSAQTANDQQFGTSNSLPTSIEVPELVTKTQEYVNTFWNIFYYDEKPVRGKDDKGKSSIFFDPSLCVGTMKLLQDRAVEILIDDVETNERVVYSGYYHLLDATVLSLHLKTKHTRERDLRMEFYIGFGSVVELALGIFRNINKDLYASPILTVRAQSEENLLPIMHCSFASRAEFESSSLSSNRDQHNGCNVEDYIWDFVFHENMHPLKVPRAFTNIATLVDGLRTGRL